MEANPSLIRTFWFYESQCWTQPETAVWPSGSAAAPERDLVTAGGNRTDPRVVESHILTRIFLLFNHVDGGQRVKYLRSNRIWYVVAVPNPIQPTHCACESDLIHSLISVCIAKTNLWIFYYRILIKNEAHFHWKDLILENWASRIVYFCTNALDFFPMAISCWSLQQ